MHNICLDLIAWSILEYFNFQISIYLNEATRIGKLENIHESTLKRVSEKYNAKVVGLDDIYDVDMDIYAPCALGATINDETLSRLKCSIIAGAANNQLANEQVHGGILQNRGIVYAPDFLINAGGIINVYAEIAKYDKAEIMSRTQNIYNTTLEILNNADVHKITTNQAALNVAKANIEARKKENNK